MDDGDIKGVEWSLDIHDGSEAKVNSCGRFPFVALVLP